MSPEEGLARLSRSRFRSSFALGEQEIAYLKSIGADTLRRHARDFVHQRLAPAIPSNDGRQTPMRGHPVFIAMHACAMCCRGCLNKWWQVPLNRPLTPQQEGKIVNFLLLWIARQQRQAPRDSH